MAIPLRRANKLAALRDLSAKVIVRTVDLDASARPDDEIIADLITVRGIGPLPRRNRSVPQVAAPTG